MWAYQTAKKMAEAGDPEPLKRMIHLVVDRRYPYALDPDQAKLQMKLAEIEAEGAADAEGKGGGQQVNVILGQMGEYAPAVMAPPVEVEAVEIPVVGELEDVMPGPKRRNPLPPEEKKEEGTWED